MGCWAFDQIDHASVCCLEDRCLIFCRIYYTTNGLADNFENSKVYATN